MSNSKLISLVEIVILPLKVAIKMEKNLEFS